MSFHDTAITGHRIYFQDQYDDAEVYAIVASAKARLMRDFPFWGYVALNLTLVEVAPGVLGRGTGMETLATDGHHIFYSAAFMKTLRDGEVEFAVAHEIAHCLLGHTGGFGRVNRRGDRDPKIYNQACDYAINGELKAAEIGEFITTIDILYDAKYEGWSSDQIYEDLIENPRDEEAGDTLDIHVEFSFGDGENDGDGEGDTEADENGNGGGSGTIKCTITPEQADEMTSDWQDAIEKAVHHVDQSGEGAGSVPVHIRRLIEKLKAVKINWKSMLRSFVVQVIRTGYSFARPNKALFNTGFSVPGFRKFDNKLQIAVAIDTSGSVGEEQLTAFVSELLGILQAFADYEIHAFCFEGDVDPSTYKVIKKTDRDAKKVLTSYATQIKGNGGTCFESVWEFMKSRRIKPRGLVFFTDGYPHGNEYTAYSQYCPTMFITVGNHTDWKSAFGLTIPYESV